ncbi:MAG: DNA repair protein RecN [Cyanophyceae cyanobacterium]
MLSCVRIENFALVDQLELEFGAGLNVLTGETGAGKSIILDAIDIALGGKVNSRTIRTGSQRALIEATFACDAALGVWLQQQEIDLLDDGSVVCTREITLSKSSVRSRSRVNGVLVNRQLMARLRDRLVEITAQGQTVQLLIPERQRQLLDLYGGHELLQQRQKVAAAFEASQQAKQALEKRRQSEQQRLQRQDLLQYQIKELSEAGLTDERELEELEQERDRLSHVVELQQLSYQVYQLLYQNETGELAAADLIGQAEAHLIDMTNYDKELESALEMVRGALTHVVEAGREIQAYGEGLETDPERLEEVEARIRTLKQICRKYGPDLAEAIFFYRQLKAELDELTDSGQSLEILEQQCRAAQETLIAKSKKLTKLRQQAAKQLEQQLVAELKPLAMEKVLFECRITPAIESAAGADRVVYYFSPNPGEAVQPLADTASGGEMSRFLLALKACFSAAGAETLIFDEIDVGVSGKVAQAIADKLHQLSHHHQVLCVTHQPLVAAMADHHFQVNKQTVEAPVSDQNGGSPPPEMRTVVRITPLKNHSSRRDELAQLTGGHSAQEAIAFAESLLAKAAVYRQAQQ